MSVLRPNVNDSSHIDITLNPAASARAHMSRLTLTHYDARLTSARMNKEVLLGGVLSLPVAPKHFRVAALAEWILSNRNRDRAKFARYSAMMCWDAALMCAWEANGIRVPAFEANSSRGAYSIVGTDNYDQLFTLTRRVRSVAELRRLPKGTFIGFIGPRHNNHQTPNDLVLRHVMIYTGNGRGIGTKNDCVYTGANPIGWEQVDLTTFFDVNHPDYAHNRHTTMVYTEITGQTLH